MSTHWTNRHGTAHTAACTCGFHNSTAPRVSEGRGYLTCPVVQTAAAEHGVLDVVGVGTQACESFADKQQ